MKSEEKLLREMGISSWSLKKNFSFDGKNILKKEIKEFSKQDIKYLKPLCISFRQGFSNNYPEEILAFLSSKKIKEINLSEIKKKSAKEKIAFLKNIEKN